ncbi:fungal-specific transcription factor domain-containing protein [Boeremia exigua]|uniref:fungal-specific transcription factor domain-containing protein n=1 Tax=Boeremia exigua TaxID=749465 RepID=UPI001E8CA79C|nr:fungal-specific transcription factor domain-containing protein [Boeremia exigua]KAH6633494.1 fungal-specific transcription factor domain-containing protein [Boeremia exigua]
MPEKASTNCWTCKQRKVGCDRTLPSCLNCRKGQRACQGFGLRLAWPDKQDGRRKQKRYEVKNQDVMTRYLPRKNGHLRFLNTVVEDLDGSKLSFRDLVQGEFIDAMSNIPMSLNMCSINEQDGMLLNHYDMQIARMTTTIDDESNGFRLALIPMALSSSDLSAQSILNATLAIACYHLGRPQQALRYKFQAIKDLSDSFSDLSIETVDPATQTRHFAASMMLCVYGVFDESDTAWAMHLEGAKSVYDLIPHIVKSGVDFKFLKPWFEYHDVLRQYTYPPQGTVAQIVLPDSTVESSKIIGVLGCSTEVLHLIQCINQLRGSQASIASPNSPGSRSTSPELKHPKLFSQIETRLLNLQQELVIQSGSTSGTIDNRRIALTAELYRVAAALYFYQTVPTTFIPVTSFRKVLRKGLEILWEMRICSSPWPLFIIGSSVTEDEDRIRILDLMEISGSSRRIGNYTIIINLLKAIWKKQDLAFDDKTQMQIDWRELVGDGGYMPSFI